MIKPVNGPVTTPFNEMRPVSNPTHEHGAVDLGAPIGTPIVAPEDGFLSAYIAFREKDGVYWPGNDCPKRIAESIPFPWRNYFYDMYGGILILESVDQERVHAIAHSFQSQFWENPMFPRPIWDHYEEKAKKRFPLHAHHTLNMPVRVRQGEQIGNVGDAGFSSGPHVHWEIHPATWEWVRWEDRINPETFI